MTELKLPEPDTHCLDDEGGRPIDVWSYSPELVRQIIAADRGLQSARHAEELEAYALTVANLQERKEELIAACVASELRAQPDDLIGDCVASISAAPQAQPERKPMDFNEMDKIVRDAQIAYCLGKTGSAEGEIVRAVEAHHGIKEKP